MSVLPYHKRYHSDALSGFMPLTLEERGAYQTLLDMMYDRGGPLVDNERLLAGYMNCSIRKWRQIRQQLLDKGKISLNRDGQIINSRARKEIENQSKTHRKSVESGSEGGRKRVENAKKSNENSESDQGSLEPPLSQPQATRARPEARSQKLEEEKAPKPPSLPNDVKAVIEAAGWTHVPPDLGMLRQWYAAGATLDQDIVPICRREARKLRDKGQPPRFLKVFDVAIREKLEADAREIEHLRLVARRNGAPP